MTRDVRSTISVVIVAGACGIVAGTPLAILGAIGRAARQGAIVKGGLYLEVLARVDTVVLDKTGTLTFGIPEVRSISAAPGVPSEAVLENAAIAERRSEHPLGRAIVRHADARRLARVEPDRFTYTPGQGIVATLGKTQIVAGNRRLLEERGVASVAPDGNDGTTVLVARDGHYLGAVRIADTLRPEAKGAIRALHQLGIRTVLLTGDARSVAEGVSRELGLGEVEAELLPEAKLLRVRALVQAGRRVAMVGDGINDAPALAAASVGVAMGSGTDVARESADIVLLGNDLAKFVDTLRLARRTRGIILANFVGTLLVDGVGMGLAALGQLTPLLAAFIHVASELAFIGNSARLIPAGTRR